MLSLQTLAWQTEEDCGASAAGCLSVPHTLQDHLGRHMSCLENALQISQRSCGAVLARWSPCSSCYKNNRDSKAQQLLSGKDPPSPFGYVFSEVPKLDLNQFSSGQLGYCWHNSMERHGRGLLLQQQGLSVGSRMVLRCKAGTMQGFGLWQTAFC